MKGISPLYQQVKEHILSRINSGEWVEAQKIPSESELVKEFSISRMTANRALRELTAEGYLVRVAGLGTFVAARKPHSHLLEIHNIADEVKSRGHTYTSKVISIKEEKASKTIAKNMDLTPGTRIFHSTVVHMEQNQPIQVEIRFVNKKVVPNYIKVDFNKTTPTEYLLKIAPLQEVEHVVQAIMPNKRIANLLKLEADEACLLVKRRTWSKGAIATYSQLFHPGKSYELTGRFRP